MKKSRLFILSMLFIVFSTMYSYAFEILQTNIPQGSTGQKATVTFRIRTDDSWSQDRDLYLFIYCNDAYDEYEEYEASPSVYQRFPFEATGEQMLYGYSQRIGKISKKSEHSVSFSLKVRRDIPDGYYSFPVYVMEGNPDDGSGTTIATADLKIWIKKSTQTSPGSEENQAAITWELGENQTTPYGVYPQVCDFALNLRNSGTGTAADVTAEIVCDQDSTKFPFDINETNYNRHFDYVIPGETVSLPYSFAIRSDTYTGYYPVKINITYREGTGAALQKAEKVFFVHIRNKNKEDEKKQNEFNANDRVKARIIVDSYSTEPAEVYAGQDFLLTVNFKNASKDVNASNLLLTFDSEKVSESPVFTTDGGSNSVVIDSLSPLSEGTVTMHFKAAAGVDQRSYAINISEKYDSPEFKNAEEKVSITVPVHQISKFNMGNVEVLPGNLQVGEEANVMFAINNTGKVQLYNVMARFESDSIQKVETYVGNIKPGATGNVDVMLTAVNPSTDDGHVKVIISYEDEYGEITETEKEIVLYVSERIEESFDDFDFDLTEEVPEEPWYKKAAVKWGGGAALLLIIALFVIIRRKKKKEL